MKLKKTYKTQAEIPEAYRAIYVAQDGQYALSKDFEGFEGDDDTPADGGGSSELAQELAQAKEELAEQKRKANEFRTNNRSMFTELEKLKNAGSPLGDVDPERAKKAFDALAKIEQQEERELLENGQLDEVVKRRMAVRNQKTQEQMDALSQANKSYEEKLAKKDERLKTLVLGDSFMSILDKMGLAPQTGAKEDILNRVYKTFELDEKERPKADGFYNDNGEPGSPEDFAQHLVENASFLFVPGKGAGSKGGEETTNKGDGSVKVISGDPFELGKNAEKVAKGEIDVSFH